MVTRYYEVEFKFKETGSGQAEIQLPATITNHPWSFIIVDEKAQKALIEVEATTAQQKKIGALSAVKSVAKKNIKKEKAAYPAPRFKKKILPIQAEPGEDADLREHEVGTFQTIRWQFYMIEVPVQDS